MTLSLVDLAREGSSDKRRELLQEISGLFVDGAEWHSDREITLFGEVFGRLLDQVPVDDRAIFSQRVAGIDQTPRELALKLAEDEFQVAAPVLEHSSALTDADLVDLAMRKSQSHLVAISKRAALSESVTDVLVDRGDSTVLNSVTRNLGARFSEVGFNQLATKAAVDASLGDALSFRADMPREVAEKLVRLISPVARQRLEFLLQQDTTKLDALFDNAVREVDESRQDNRRSRLEAKVAVADIRSGRRSVDEVLLDLIRKERMIDIALVLAEVAGVPEPHVSNVLHKVNATGIAIVCRSVDMSDAVYSHLGRLRCKRLRLNAAQGDHMVKEYRDLDRATAERALRFHKVRSSVQIAAR